MPSGPPPPTGDNYIDSCFDSKLEELSESRQWHQIPDLASIPSLATSGRHDTALETILKALDHYPDYDFLYTWLGHIQGERGRPDLARDALLKGIQRSRSKSGLCDDLGMLEFEASHLPEAVQWWVRSCAIQLAYGHLRHANPFLRLATIALAIGLPECHTALLQTCDRIQYVRLNAAGEEACVRLVYAQGTKSIRQAIEMLCTSYLGRPREGR